MNKTLRVLYALALISLAAFTVPSANALTVLTPTTLSAAIADSSVQVMTVTSATGFTVATQTVAYIDNELVFVKSVSGTSIGIIRGYGGTNAHSHSSGALVFVGAPNLFFASRSISPQGTCVRANEAVLPYINTNTGVISDCVGGQWVQGFRTPEPRFRVYAPEPGAVLYTSVNTTGTTLGATTLYCVETVLPYNKLLTGIALLNGTTVGTDKHYVALYDNTGNVVANSALAGVTTSGASVFQQFAFTSTYYAVGPAQYFACFQTNGTTDTVRMAVTGVNDNQLTKGQTGATFGTLPALTVPTTFTTAVGPYVYLY